MEFEKNGCFFLVLNVNIFSSRAINCRKEGAEDDAVVQKGRVC